MHAPDQLRELQSTIQTAVEAYENASGFEVRTVYVGNLNDKDRIRITVKPMPEQAKAAEAK